LSIVASPPCSVGRALYCSSMPDVLHEFEGKFLIPPLVRVAGGWAEQQPPPCACGSGRALIGWTSCGCRVDVLAPGHRTWECVDCGRYVALGCHGSAGPGPMESYGGRAGRPSPL